MFASPCSHLSHFDASDTRIMFMFSLGRQFRGKWAGEAIRGGYYLMPDLIGLVERATGGN